MRGRPGFFGKLPSRGDFVQRGLAQEFVAPWDDWLQAAMAASEAALGERWLDTYLTSPIWRYALSPGLCGAEAYVGVLMPSVDKVGRYFPLAAAAPCGRTPAALALIAELDAWYGEVESAMLATLADTPLELDAFDERLSRLGVPAALGIITSGRGIDMDKGNSSNRAYLHCRVPPGEPLGSALLAQLAARLERGLGAFGIWWTQGSELVAPCVLSGPGLPAPSAFAAMLDGRWSEHGWAMAELSREGGSAAAGLLREGRSAAAGSAGDSAAAYSTAGRHSGRPAPAELVLRSGALTDAGWVRSVNEDAYARRDDLGLWLVADGLGGHKAGHRASRMAVRAAERALEGGGRPDGGLRERLTPLAVALESVNACLRVLAELDGDGLSASTVAALVVEGDEAACLWAGDSRIYRLRGGALDQLTRDHADAIMSDRAITRAVGGEDHLELDVEHARVAEGDRFLLCTDGLYAEVTAGQIVEALSMSDPQAACERLRDLVLAGEARDNLTAVAVFAERGER